MHKPLVKLFLALLATTVLTACGFQLRGQASFDFDRINRQGLENTQMARNMDMALQIHNLDVNTGASPVTLTLISDERERSIVTFSATGRAREVRISYSLVFSVKDRAGDFLIADTTLTQTRELTYNDDQILGKEAEENRLYREMQSDIARQIVSRLSSISLGKSKGS